MGMYTEFLDNLGLVKRLAVEGDQLRGVIPVENEILWNILSIYPRMPLTITPPNNARNIGVALSGRSGGFDVKVHRVNEWGSDN